MREWASWGIWNAVRLLVQVQRDMEVVEMEYLGSLGVLSTYSDC